jgi:hypothetical protein
VGFFGMPCADDLEKQMGALAAKWKKADLIYDKQVL